MRTTLQLVAAACMMLTASNADARPRKHHKRHKPTPKHVRPVETPADDVKVADDRETPAAKAAAEPVALALSPTSVEAEPKLVVAAEPEPRVVVRAKHRRPLGIYFRAGALHSETNLGNTHMTLESSLPIDMSKLEASGVEMDESQIPAAAIVGYILPVLDRRLAVETILGFPLKAHFQATGPLATESLAPTFAGLPTGIQPLGPELGEATFATPVVTAVYRLPDLGPVTALVGAGGMLLVGYGGKVTNPVLLAAGEPRLAISPSVGVVLQGGLETRLWRNVAARVDIKYVAAMTVETRVENISMIPRALPLVGAVDVGTAVMTADIAPLIVQAGIGADF